MSDTTLKPILPAANPPAWLGVMGGGQLGRMFAQAAQSMGYQVAVLEPAAPARPARSRSAWSTPATAMPPASTRWPRNALPSPPSLKTSRPTACRAWRSGVRGAQRAWRVGGAGPHCREALLRRLRAKSGVLPAPHKVIATQADIDAIGDELLPGILKTVRMGYDGKGQVRVRARRRASRVRIHGQGHLPAGEDAAAGV
jgi:5-(carboxyamino)imidazole ribonucleotide synthase